ncbi:MAG: DUF6268 family outer membrane beta-barrel protein [Bacteroidota bacterium]
MPTIRLFSALAMWALLIGPAYAQLSIAVEAVPYRLSDATRGQEGGEGVSNTMTVAFSYPFTLNKHRTRLHVGVVWEHQRVDVRGRSGLDPDMTAFHAGGVNVSLLHPVSPTWSLLGVVTPGVASDLKGPLTPDDFNIQVMVAALRRTSPYFAFGLGAAYSTQFGAPLPMPIFVADWNNGRRLRWVTLFPSISEFWYDHTDRTQWGFAIRVEGQAFQGDPSRYAGHDPELRHSVVSVGPSARWALAPKMELQVEAGVVPYHRLEFYEGRTEIVSFSAQESAFLRLTVHLGR